MIHVHKNFDDIPEILRSEQVEKSIQEALSGTPPTFDGRISAHPSVKEMLTKIYHGKCGYCESNVGKFDSLEIDHYRPMYSVKNEPNHKGYYWLTYEWSNLVPTCKVCDQNKSNNFPIARKRVEEPQSKRDQWFAGGISFQNENALLFHPELDYPENFLEVLPSGKISARDHNPRAEKTIQICKLNREQLTIARRAIIEAFQKECLVAMLSIAQNEVDLDEIAFQKKLEPISRYVQESTYPTHEYSLVGKSIMENVGLFLENLFTDSQKENLVKAFEANQKSSFTGGDDSFDKTNNSGLDLRMLAEAPEQKIESQSSQPYSLSEFQIEKFQCLREIGPFSIPSDCPFVFIFGENGTGKTSLLQALTIGACGTKNASFLESQKNCHIRLRIREGNYLKSNHIQWYPSHKTWTPIDRPNYVCAYGPSRLDIQSHAYNIDKEIQDIEPDKNLLDQRGILKNIEHWFSMEGHREASDPKIAERRKSTLRALESLLPNVSEIAMQDGYLLFCEKGYWAKFHEIASGHKSVVATIGDLLIRLFSMQPEETKPENLQGIVLIDELDTHLHPSYQRQFPKMLHQIFPKIQFICSTHSPFPLLEAPKHSQFFLIERKEDDGYSTLREMGEFASGDYALQGWTVEEILNDAMGFHDYRSSLYQATLQNFVDALDEDDASKAEEAYKILEKIIHPRSAERKLLELQMTVLGEEEQSSVFRTLRPFEKTQTLER